MYDSNTFSSDVAVTTTIDESRFPEQRIARYYLLHGKKREFLGITLVPTGLDMDDAFPPFHSVNFDESHLDYLSTMIRKGAVLTAECSYDNEMFMLAYILGDEDYWYGRESTLKYFCPDFNFKPAFI